MLMSCTDPDKLEELAREKLTQNGWLVLCHIMLEELRNLMASQVLRIVKCRPFPYTLSQQAGILFKEDRAFPAARYQRAFHADEDFRT